MNPQEINVTRELRLRKIKKNTTVITEIQRRIVKGQKYHRTLLKELKLY